MTDYTQLIVVYDADGTFVGEVTYIVGSVLGLRHCSACDITHSLSQIGQGTGGEKPEWTAFKKTLNLPVVQLHRDDLTTSRSTLRERVPFVAGERKDNGELEVIVSNQELIQCQGSVPKLQRLIEQALDTKLTAASCPRRKASKKKQRSATPVRATHNTNNRTTDNHRVPSRREWGKLFNYVFVAVILYGIFLFGEYGASFLMNDLRR